MFLHIQTFGKQISIHASEKKPLLSAVKRAMEYYEQEDGDVVAVNEVTHNQLDLSKTAEENDLVEGDVIRVINGKTLRKELADKEEKERLLNLSPEDMLDDRDIPKTSKRKAKK